ncbi:MAG: Rpn family recombination-promoting nuclease/putative transposase, partial [Anaerolineales bacterium]|nr:Rpn family recombination-promoting nuclease/putative transposase [Anaerolineales bacterium]MDW8446992.1 Rpn family recombination-promoting nuclease/putative transposase [Anaerolineales bacterium]
GFAKTGTVPKIALTENAPCQNILVAGEQPASHRQPMADLSNPHDRYFRETLAQPTAARDFLRYYLPTEVAALLDPDETPELMRDSFVEPELHEHLSDLLYRVRLRNARDAYVYILIEHKSYPYPEVAFQLLRYMVQIWEGLPRRHSALHPIVPMVVYHGAVEAGGSTAQIVPGPAGRIEALYGGLSLFLMRSVPLQRRRTARRGFAEGRNAGVEICISQRTAGALVGNHAFDV